MPRCPGGEIWGAQEVIWGALEVKYGVPIGALEVKGA